LINQINGLHHITSLTIDAADNNKLFTRVLGLRRVKKTVNFDQPNVYHLYYGDKGGSPGTVMTYFPFPNIKKGIRGTGEVAETVFSVPIGSLAFWADRLKANDLEKIRLEDSFGEKRLRFVTGDGEGFALAEIENDTRVGWTENSVSKAYAIRGIHAASMRLQDNGAMIELLNFMGYQQVENRGNLTRFVVQSGSAANILDIESLPNVKLSCEGAGSVHHIAFSVKNRATQLEVRKALVDTGYAVTPVIDRDYFWSIYFRTVEGILFEIATNEPGFEQDEDIADLGQTLKLPAQHEHRRSYLEQVLESIDL
jgi:glyoxalase family protein